MTLPSSTEDHGPCVTAETLSNLGIGAARPLDSHDGDGDGDVDDWMVGR